MSAISIAERAVLERDRIARQKRRNTAIENDTTKKKIKTYHEKAPDTDVIEISDDENPGISIDIARRPVTSGGTTHEERFWHGESRSVRNQLVDNPDATFSLDEIVGKVSGQTYRYWSYELSYALDDNRAQDDLDLVIAASFCWEMDWFSQHFPDPRQVPTVILTQPTNESNGRVREVDDHSEGFRTGKQYIAQDTCSTSGSMTPTNTADFMGRLGRVLRLPTRRLWLSAYEIPSALLQIWSPKGRRYQREYAIR
jgi:hypothetical protein